MQRLEVVKFWPCLAPRQLRLGKNEPSIKSATQTSHARATTPYYASTPGTTRSRETNFVAAVRNDEEWHYYTPFKGSAGSGTSGRLVQGTAG